MISKEQLLHIYCIIKNILIKNTQYSPYAATVTEIFFFLQRWGVKKTKFRRWRKQRGDMNHFSFKPYLSSLYLSYLSIKSLYFFIGVFCLTRDLQNPVL